MAEGREPPRRDPPRRIPSLGPRGARPPPPSGSTWTPRTSPSPSTPRAGDRLSAMWHQAYGPLTGVPRVLDLLERHNLQATFFCPGYTAERYPDLLRRVRDAGHEIAHHGYLHEAMAGMTRDKEAAVLDRGLEASTVSPVSARSAIAPRCGRRPTRQPSCSWTAGSSTTRASWTQTCRGPRQAAEEKKGQHCRLGVPWPSSRAVRPPA